MLKSNSLLILFKKCNGNANKLRNKFEIGSHKKCKLYFMTHLKTLNTIYLKVLVYVLLLFVLNSSIVSH